jgi:hypothetical protein
MICPSMFHCIGVLNLLTRGISFPRHYYIIHPEMQTFVTPYFNDYSIHPFKVTTFTQLL